MSFFSNLMVPALLCLVFLVAVLAVSICCPLLPKGSQRVFVSCGRCSLRCCF